MVQSSDLGNGVVVDTNIFISVEQGRLEPEAVISTIETPLFIAAITVSELLAGVHLAKSREIRIRRSAFVEGIIGSVPMLEFNKQVARVYAEIFAHFIRPRAKATTDVHDLQIAATAIANGYCVMTQNIADFRNIPGVALQPIEIKKP